MVQDRQMLKEIVKAKANAKLLGGANSTDEPDEGLIKRLSEPLTLAFLNAYGQLFVSLIVVTFSIMGAVGGVSQPPAVNLRLPFGLTFGTLFYSPAVLSLALIPAWTSRRWQIVAVIATLLNAGIMLLFALTSTEGFFLPMVGYLVSAWLVGRVWIRGRENSAPF